MAYYPESTTPQVRTMVATAVRRGYSDPRLHVLASEYLRWPTSANWMRLANELNNQQVIGSSNTGGDV